MEDRGPLRILKVGAVAAWEWGWSWALRQTLGQGEGLGGKNVLDELGMEQRGGS